MWKEYTNALLGLCVAVVAFLGFTGATLAWTLGILGAAILIISLLGASALSSQGFGQQSHA